MKILVVGDIIFDKYTHVSTDRMSQESDCPIYDLGNTEDLRPGGAANVAANVAALAPPGSTVHISGIVPRDTSMYGLMTNGGVGIVNSPFSNVKLEKHRFIDDGEIVFRLDNNKHFDSESVKAFEALFWRNFVEEDYDAIIISDYDKGTITRAVADIICTSKPLVIVDSKRYDLNMFKGAEVLNINKDEHFKQSLHSDYIVEWLFDYVLVTHGEDGSELRSYYDEKYEEVHFATSKVDTVDVTGCGDTHTAAFTVKAVESRNMAEAAIYATKCATLAVQKFGTSIISRGEVA